MKTNHYIYITTNKLNGKKYVGRCSNIAAWEAGYLGSGKWLKLSIKKYGKENFERSTLEEIYGDIKEAIVAEEKWISYYDAKNNEDFYNLSENCGGFDKGDTHTDATKKLISEKTSKAMKAMGREYYANRKQSGTGRTPSNKGKKFIKGTEEYERVYGKRKKQSLKPNAKRVEEIKQAWKEYLESGGSSARAFQKQERISRLTFTKIIDGTFQPRTKISYEELSHKEIVKYENLYYNENMTKNCIIKHNPITKITLDKILLNYQRRLFRKEN